MTNADAKHTPGPWASGIAGQRMTDDYTQPFAVYEANKPNLVAGCFGDVDGGSAVAQANSRLIAAAPDLLEALTDLLGAYEGADRFSMAARAALAKAGA